MASRIRKGSAMELGRYGARGSLRDEHSMGRSGVDGRMGGASLDVDRSTRAIPDFAYSPLVSMTWQWRTVVFSFALIMFFCDSSRPA